MTTAPPGPVIAISGPTASGKSALADRVAKRLDSAVISCDAMQLYRGMDIGTAKLAPHEHSSRLLMVDVADVGEQYSVARYQRRARAEVDALIASGSIPVLCGGTGLYLDAVIDEMSFPSGSLESDSRRRWESFATAQGADALHAELARRDAASAALIHPNNLRRVVRALELFEQGQSYAEQHRGLLRRQPHYAARIWGITMDRDRLYRRIDRRVDEMLERGLVDEVRLLDARGLRMSRTASQAIGYKELLAYLDGTLSLDEARNEMKLRTRRYAKRQLSWLRRDGRVRWLDYDRIGEDEALRQVLGELGRAVPEVDGGSDGTL